MEQLIAELINNPKMPKWLRYAIVTLVCGSVIFLGIMLARKSPMTVGKVFGAALSVLFIIAAIYLFVKIASASRRQ